MKKPKIGQKYSRIDCESLNTSKVHVIEEILKNQSLINLDWKAGNCYPNIKSAKAVAREIKTLMMERSREA